MKKRELAKIVANLHTRVSALEGPTKIDLNTGTGVEVPEPGAFAVALEPPPAIPEPLDEIRVTDEDGDGLLLDDSWPFTFGIKFVGIPGDRHTMFKSAIPDLITALQKIWETRHD